MDERAQKLLQSVLGKTREKVISKGGKAAQSGKRKDDLLLERSHGGLAGTVRRGQHEKGRGDGKRREARYLLPCLSESKRCQKVGGRETEIEDGK